MEFVRTEIPGIVVVEPDVRDDPRGWFFEVYQRQKFAGAGLEADFVQDNHSHSIRGTLRGMHLQHPHGQVKLVRVVRGEVFDAVVDVRRGSPTFGKAYWTVLSEANRRQLWIPAGFAHGFCVLSEVADVHYKLSSLYDPETEAGIAWDDPDIGIEWPIAEPQTSERDRSAPRLAEIADELPF
jgi:dTDP-4-dehydrorhamnose 3,5-epimerase